MANRFGGVAVDNQETPPTEIKQQRFGGTPVEDVPPTGDMSDWQGSATPEPDDDPDGAIAGTFKTLGRFIGSMGAGFNQEVANTLGLPGDVTNRLLSMAGIKSRAAGSKEIEEILDSFPVTQTSQAGDNQLAGNIGRFAAYVPGLTTAAVRSGNRLLTEIPNEIVTPEGAGMARRAYDAVRGTWRDLSVSAAKSPGRTAIQESAAAVGAAAGATVGQRIGESYPSAGPTAEMVGAIVGGATPGAISAGIRGLPGVVSSNTEQRVAEFFQRAAGDQLPKAVDNLRARTNEFGADLTPATLSQNTGLLRLERAMSKGSDTLGTAIIERRQAGDAALQGAIADTAPGTATREAVDQFFDGRIDKISSMVDERIAQAAESARKAADEIPPEIRGDQANRLAREELDRAYVDARTDESALWNNINSAKPTQTHNTQGAVERINREFDPGVQNSADLPGEVMKQIDELKDAEGLGRLLKLRSRVLDDIRKARSGDTPNRRMVSHLEGIQEAVLNDIGATAASQARITKELGGSAAASIGSEATKVRAALNFSRELNDKFTRGPVGKLLGYERTGGMRTPDELTLTKIMQPGFMGQRNAKALIDAVGGTEKMRGMMENYLRDQYLNAVSTPGSTEINQAAHTRFVKRHGELLNDFPAARADIENVASANAMLAARNVQGARARNLLAKSRAQLWLDTDDVGKSLMRVMNTPTRVTRGGRNFRQINQAEAAKNLMTSAAKDETGMATEGVRREFMQTLLKMVKTGPVNPTIGEKSMTPAKLRKYLTDNRGAVSAILDLGQEARLRRILVEAEKANAVHSVTTGGGSDTFENSSMMTSIIGRVIGAKIASVVSPGTAGMSLQTAQIGSKLGLRFVESLSAGQANALIEQSLLDPKVLLDMLTRPTNLKGGERVLVEKLKSHLVAAGMPAPDDEE